MRGGRAGEVAAALAAAAVLAAAAWTAAGPGVAAEGAGMSIVVALAGDSLAMAEGGVHLRGGVAVHNYDPREGHMFQEIRAEPSGRVVSKTKIFVRGGAGGDWVAQIGATLTPEAYPPGGYSIRAVTESGLGSPRVAFTVSGGPGAAPETGQKKSCVTPASLPYSAP